MTTRMKWKKTRLRPSVVAAGLVNEWVTANGAWKIEERRGSKFFVDGFRLLQRGDLVGIPAWWQRGNTLATFAEAEALARRGDVR